MTLPLFPDEGAAPLGSNGRTKDIRRDDTGSQPKREEPQRGTSLRLTPPAHHNAPPGTSNAAARQIAGHSAQQRAEVLAVIVRAGAFGATDAEVEQATGIRAQSVSPRRGELRKLGLIVDSGQRRPTPRGRPAAVWVAVTPSCPATPTLGSESRATTGPTAGPDEAGCTTGRREG